MASKCPKCPYKYNRNLRVVKRKQYLKNNDLNNPLVIYLKLECKVCGYREKRYFKIE